MNTNGMRWDRLAAITDVAERMAQQSGDFGRTAAMKLMYLLQTIKGVPLGYNFTLYAYGPFDSTVLDDVSYAASLQALSEKVIYFSGGYGYDIRPSDNAGQVKAKAGDFLKEHQDSFAWVVNEFGKYSASDLELISTIVYADRELESKKTQVDLDAFIARVRKIKPHFTEEQVKRRTQELQKKELLKSILN